MVLESMCINCHESCSTPSIATLIVGPFAHELTTMRPGILSGVLDVHIASIVSKHDNRRQQECEPTRSPCVEHRTHRAHCWFTSLLLSRQLPRMPVPLLLRCMSLHSSVCRYLILARPSQSEFDTVSRHRLSSRRSP